MSLTWQGSEFQALAAAAGNARSPSVEQRVVGTNISQSDDLDPLTSLSERTYLQSAQYSAGNDQE